MFNDFLLNYIKDESVRLTINFDMEAKSRLILQSKFPSLFQLFENLGGSSYNQGLYRVHSFESSLYWTHLVTNYFKKYQGLVYSFGYDWLGRHFVMDCKKYIKGEKLIYIFDPAEGQAYEVPMSLEDFHNDELVNYSKEALEKDTFKKWFDLNQIRIPVDKCVGFKVPLFLGGQDVVDNYELVDMEVFWDLSSQFYYSTNNLPEGEVINKVTLEDPLFRL